MSNEDIPNGERLHAFIKAHRIPLRGFALAYGVTPPTLYNSTFVKHHGPDSVGKICEIFKNEFEISEENVRNFQIAMSDNSPFDLPISQPDLIEAINSLTKAILELTKKMDAR